MALIEGATSMIRGFVVVRAYRVVWFGMTVVYGCCGCGDNNRGSGR